MSRPVEFVGLGDRQHVSGDRQRASMLVREREQAEAVRRREHYWLAFVTYRVVPPMREGAMLDAENLRGIPVLGCFICEEPWSDDAPRRCPGEPVR